MELEDIKQRYEEAQSLLNSPDLFLGKTQSLLEQLLKLNYKKSAGKGWESHYGGMDELINSLWSYDPVSQNNIHQARKIRNKYAHEGYVTDEEAREYGSVIGEYISYLEAGQLQSYEKSQDNIREETEIRRHGIILTAIFVALAIGVSMIIGDSIGGLPIIGPILSFLLTFIVVLFSFLYVIRRYALLSLIILIVAIFSGGLGSLILLVLGLVAMFYISRFFVNKWLGWYVYSYLINSWYFVLSQFPFSLFSNVYFSTQTRKAQKEREEFERKQKEYAEKSQKAYEEWEKAHHTNNSSDTSQQSTSAYDPYKILGVTPETSLSEIKKAYRTLAKAYHPDLNKEPGSENKFKEIQEAWEEIMKRK